MQEQGFLQKNATNRVFTNDFSREQNLTWENPLSCHNSLARYTRQLARAGFLFAISVNCRTSFLIFSHGAKLGFSGASGKTGLVGGIRF
jgi:hypothetical protein